MKKKLALLTIFVAAAATIWIWLIDFTGLQSIRFYCYNHRFCNPIAQVIENPFWQKLFPTTKVFDPFFWPLTLSKPKISEEKIYRLIIQNNDFQNLVDNLPIDPKGYLTSKYKKTQPATLIHSNQSIPVKVRFRGISFNHWRNPKKSWRIYLSTPTQSGKKVLDFIIPEDKNFFVYFAAGSYAKKLGIMLPQPEIAYLSINNGQFLPYLLLEIHNNDFLERRGASAGPLFVDRDPYPDMPPLYENIEGWEVANANDLPNPPDFAPIKELVKLMQLNDAEFERRLPSLVDIQSLYAWNALAMLLGNRLEDEHHNALIYQNPASGKLEFIPSDIGIDTRRIFEESKLSTFDQNYNPLVSRILNIPAFKQQRNELLEKFTAGQDNLSQALATADSEYRQATPYFLQDSWKNYSNISYFVETARVRRALIERFDHINKVLTSNDE